MKKIKKSLSAMLVLIMAFLLVVPAFAAQTGNDGTITVKNAEVGKEYQAYRLFDLTFDEKGGHYGYTVNAEWNEFFTKGAGKDLVTIDTDNGSVTLKNETAAGLQTLAQAAKTYAKENVGKVTAVKATADATEVTFSNLPLGYYLVATDAGALQALDTTNKNAVMYEKNSEPTIDKSADKVSAAYGETVHFTVPVVKGGYAWGDYVIRDTLTGLELKADKITVKVNGVALATEKYTVESTTSTLKVTIPEATLNERNADNTDFVYPAGTKFVIEYDAIAKATVSMENKVVMDYKTDPNTTIQTQEHIVKVANYEFDVKKTDGKDLLNGATFQLHQQADCADIAMEFIKTGNTYRLAMTGETAAEGSEKTSQITAGNATIEGLAAGTYYLKEISAPAGYNKLVKPVKVEITAVVNENTGSAYYHQAFDDQGKRLAPEIKMNDQVVSAAGNTFVLEIVNKTGTELPSTGGIGTTIFYVVGGLLMAGAVVALVVKKRVEK